MTSSAQTRAESLNVPSSSIRNNKAAVSNNNNQDNVSVVSAYREDETYAQVSDLLKGIIKEDRQVRVA